MAAAAGGPDVFRLLTKCITFDKKRFRSDAVKFGLIKAPSDGSKNAGPEDLSNGNLARQRLPRQEEASQLLEDDLQGAVDLSSTPSSSSDSEDGDGCLTLLGDIKASGGALNGKNGSKKNGKKSKQPKNKKTKAEIEKERKVEKVNRFRNIFRIHVSGSDIPDPVDTWDRLTSLSPELKRAVVDSCGFSRPTPVQMQAIPLMMEGRDVLVCAPTGSGKTAAYLVPMIHLLNQTQSQAPPRHRKGRLPRGLVVAPTRELAAQIFRECSKLCEAAAVGGGGTLKPCLMDKMEKLAGKGALMKADILVSTPNRLVHLLKGMPPDGTHPPKSAEVDLSGIQVLVVDESDKLFEAGPNGFREQLAQIYRACCEEDDSPSSSGSAVEASSSSNQRKRLQRAMFSATLAPDVEQWCRLNLDNVCSVTVGTRNTATHDVRQRLEYTGTEKGKLLAFKQLVEAGELKPPVLVFVQTKERAVELSKELASQVPELGQGHRVGVIHSGRSQLQRDQTVTDFRCGRVWVLICTELMGRGVDFKGVNLVVNYDFPPSTVSYIHRIGRTGRAGRQGQAVTFFTDADRTLLRSVAQIVKDSGNEVPDYMLRLKKASRQEKRKLANHAVKRAAISTESLYDKEKRLKMEAMIRGSKNRKRKREEREAAKVKKSMEVDQGKKRPSISPAKKIKT